MNVSSAGDIPAYCDRGSRLSIAQGGLDLLIFAKRKKDVSALGTVNEEPHGSNAVNYVLHASFRADQLEIGF